MKKSVFLIALVFVSYGLFAQGIGKVSVNFRDASRTGGFAISGAINFPSNGTGRNIGTEIYYPASSTGNNTPIVPGDYPIVVFGHGFSMAWDAYQNIWEALVPNGYIVAFPRTEGGLSPSHSNFGLDLRLVETLIQEMGATSGNIIYGNVSPNAAIMGHSMGGGSTFLAAGDNNSPTLKTVVGLAPAETNPSAIAAAATINVDVLVLSGSTDGVTPPSQHHLPIYNAVSNNCKYFISLIGGGHCRFANANFNCDFGETTSGGPGSLTRPQVHAITNSTIIPWFDFKLKGECSAWTDFQNFLATGGNIAVTNDCSHDVIPVVSISPSSPIIACIGENLDLTYGPVNPEYTYQWFNETGAIVGATESPFNTTQSGEYFVQATSLFNCSANSSTTSVTFVGTISPTFNQVDPICIGMMLNDLPTTSLNGIVGTWSPQMNNQTTTTYYFTPAPGQPSGNDCAETASMTIVVYENPIVTITAIENTLEASPGFNSYVWSLNGTEIPGANNATCTPISDGKYTVLVSDSNGCQGTASFNFSTSSLSHFDGEFQFYPNPSQGLIHLTFSDIQTRRVNIYDLVGNLVYMTSFTGHESTLQLNQLAQGSYFLLIDQGNETFHVQIVIQR